MNRRYLLASLVLAAAAPSGATVVFSSGAVPDLTDAANFTYADNAILEFPAPPPDAFYYRQFFEPETLAQPVTVRSVEFYGYTEWVDGLGGPDHGFELIIDGLVTVLNVVRTDVAPALPTDFGVLATPVQRIQIDIEPVTFDATDVQIRGDTGPFADFFMALADPAIPQITLEAYSDASLTVTNSTTVGAAHQFTFFDAFQTIQLGDANGDGAVDLLDLDILGANFGATGATMAQGDFSGDGAVDLLDLDILGANFGAGTATSAPEPAALAMLILGLLAASRHKAR